MTTVKNLLAGLGGAVALNILHESLKKASPEMPRIDIVGEEALQKTLNYFGTGIANPDNMYKATLGADVISNALYYSMIGVGGSKYVWSKALASGFSAGIGAITLPQRMGLNSNPVTKSATSKTLTVAYYVAGALVTAAILTAIEDKK